MNETDLDKLKRIIMNVQKSTYNHDNYLKELINYYQQEPNVEFVDFFKTILQNAFLVDVDNSDHLQRFFDFCALFVVSVSESTANNSTTNDKILSTNQFLIETIDSALQYHDVNLPLLRFRSCYMINSILKYLGERLLDNEVCNRIEAAMFRRIYDSKVQIRCQAYSALARLQDSGNVDCPVRRAIINGFHDPKRSVRKSIVEGIIICPQTIPKILDRMIDCEPSVRFASYKRCMLINPDNITVEQKHKVLYFGFNEEDKKIKEFFEENLLSKWFSYYGKDYLMLLTAINKNASLKEIKKLEFMNKNLLETYFKKNPINEIINFLPINDDKFIPYDRLTKEATFFWRILINFLKTKNDGFLDEVLPPLLNFCDYIYRFCQEGKDVVESLNFSDFEMIVWNFLEILEVFDVSDEVSREKVQKVLIGMLSLITSSEMLLCKILKILNATMNDVDLFSNEVCSILTKILERFVEESSDKNTQDKKYQLAQLKYEVFLLIENQKKVVEDQGFEEAAVIKDKIISMKSEINDIEMQLYREGKNGDDNDRTDMALHFINVFIALLIQPNIKEITVCMKRFIEIISPSIASNFSIVRGISIRCLGLCCMLDYDLTTKNFNVFFDPIIKHRSVPSSDIEFILMCVEILTDLVIIHGSKLFSNSMESQSTTSSNNSFLSYEVMSRQMNKSRRLYNVDATTGELNRSFKQYYSLDGFFECIFDLLNDKDEEMQVPVVKCLSVLLRTGLINSAPLIGRLFFKWLTPSTGKHDLTIQQLIGFGFIWFGKRVTKSEEIFIEALVLVLSNIATTVSNFSRNKTLNAIRSMLYFSSLKTLQRTVDVHTRFSKLLLLKIKTAPNDAAIPLYTRTLLYLQLPRQDISLCRELLEEVDSVLERISGIKPIKYLQKFKRFLMTTISPNNSNNDNNTVQESIEGTRIDSSSESAPDESKTDNNHSKEVSLEKKRNLDEIQESQTQLDANANEDVEHNTNVNSYNENEEIINQPIGDTNEQISSKDKKEDRNETRLDLRRKIDNENNNTNERTIKRHKSTHLSIVNKNKKANKYQKLKRLSIKNRLRSRNKSFKNTCIALNGNTSLVNLNAENTENPVKRFKVMETTNQSSSQSLVSIEDFEIISTKSREVLLKDIKSEFTKEIESTEFSKVKNGRNEKSNSRLSVETRSAKRKKDLKYRNSFEMSTEKAEEMPLKTKDQNIRKRKNIESVPDGKSLLSAVNPLSNKKIHDSSKSTVSNSTFFNYVKQFSQDAKIEAIVSLSDDENSPTENLRRSKRVRKPKKFYE